MDAPLQEKILVVSRKIQPEFGGDAAPAQEIAISLTTREAALGGSGVVVGVKRMVTSITAHHRWGANRLMAQIPALRRDYFVGT